MTLEFFVPQPHQQEGNMYRHSNPATHTYPSYNYSQTPTIQYPSEYPPGTTSYQPSTAVDVHQQQPPPTTNSWAAAGFPTAGVPSAVDWGSSQDLFVANVFPGQTPAGPVSDSPYSTDELDYYQSIGPFTAAVNSVSQALRPALRSPYHDWMRPTSYRVNPQTGKTRTKDKYRVVYSDHQRLELEKEFHCSRYITIRRKAELGVSLGLSERQVKIWFQNRRAKERKQNKKRAALGGESADQTQVGVSSDGKDVAEGELDFKKEKVIKEELETVRRSPSSTPEFLEIACTHRHHRSTTEPELSLNAPQLYLLGRGASQLHPTHYAARPDSLVQALPQMHML